MKKTRFLLVLLLGAIFCGYKDSDLVKKNDVEDREKAQVEINKELVTDIDDKEFIINYKMKSKDFVAQGDIYQVSIPLNNLKSNEQNPLIDIAKNDYIISKTCNIDIEKTKDFYITTKSNYTQKESFSAKNRQEMQILYTLLNDYRSQVIDCIILNKAQIDSLSLSINNEARIKDVLSTNPVRVLASLSGKIFSVKIISRGSNENSDS